MQAVKIVSQDRCGLHHPPKIIEPITRLARATIPAVEALQAAGATVVQAQAPGVYEITLGDRMPDGIVAVHLNEQPHLGLRLLSELAYPVEYPDYWGQVDWTPCPECQAPLLWYESGYVPGYRVCTRPPHHHSLAK